MRKLTLGLMIVALCGALGTATTQAHVPDDCGELYSALKESWLAVGDMNHEYFLEYFVDHDGNFHSDAPYGRYKDLSYFTHPLWQGSSDLHQKVSTFLDCLDPLFIQWLEQLYGQSPAE